MNRASRYGREWKLSFTLATLARWGLAALLVVIAFIAFADDPEPTEVRWRTEGTIPKTWVEPFRRATIPPGEAWDDAIPVTTFTDGSIRVIYASGPPACVWEGPTPPRHVGGGRTLAEAGDEGWLKGGWGGVIYAASGRTCPGFSVEECRGIC